MPTSFFYSMIKPMGTEIFKAHDIRTKEENLSKQVMDNLIDAIVCYYCREYKIKKIVIGKDARLMAPVLASLAVEKFTEAGVDVYTNSRPVSTCQFYFTCMKYNRCSGLMFTASHNPKQYIGIKLIADDLLPVSMGSGLEKIKDCYDKKLSFEPAAVKGTVHYIDETDDYISYCMKLAEVEEGSLSGMNLLFEFLCGSAGYEITRAFKKAGATVCARNVEPNGNFPAGDPNPLIETSVAPARKAMMEGSYDLGFCFDGDGDRMDIMAKDGKQIPPSVNASMIMNGLLKIFDKGKNNFYVDMKAMPNACKEMARCGAQTHLICNGHAMIKRKLRENCKNGYIGAVEESAHYYLNFPDFGGGFAAVEFTLFYALLSAKCYRNESEKYEKAIKMRDEIFRAREWTIHCEDKPEKMPAILANVKEKMQSLGAVVVNRMDDGSDLEADLMRINLPETITDKTDLSKKWVQVAQRISRSEDGLCRFEVTSNSESECNEINSEILEVTKKLERELK